MRSKKFLMSNGKATRETPIEEPSENATYATGVHRGEKRAY